MNDLLKQSAVAYRNLMRYQYHFTLGHKGKLYKFSLAFPEFAYYHLAGLHKVSISVLRNRKGALDTILSGSVTEGDLMKTGVNLHDRLEGICGLQHMLESAHVVFRYRGHERAGSRIPGDYLIVDEQTIFLLRITCRKRFFHIEIISMSATALN